METENACSICGADTYVDEIDDGTFGDRDRTTKVRRCTSSVCRSTRLLTAAP